jgi:hypothetical protein
LQREKKLSASPLSSLPSRSHHHALAPPQFLDLAIIPIAPVPLCRCCLCLRTSSSSARPHLIFWIRRHSHRACAKLQPCLSSSTLAITIIHSSPTSPSCRRHPYLASRRPPRPCFPKTRHHPCPRESSTYTDRGNSTYILPPFQIACRF